MVKKSSKRGLNTGNTIRNRRSGVTAYDYISVHEESNAQYGDYQDRYELLSQVIPSPQHCGVEYSLSKKQRWELVPHLRELVRSKEGNNQEKVNLYLHQEGMNSARLADEFASSSTIAEFQTNMGPVKSKISNRRKMNMRTANLPHSTLDHLSKRERRKLGKEKFVDMRKTEKDEVESQCEDVQSTLNCHVVQRAPQTGLMLSKPSHGDGKPRPSGKRHRAAKTVNIDDLYMDEFDDDFQWDEEHSTAAPRSTTASIAEYLESRQQTSRVNGHSISSDEDSNSQSFKGNIQYIIRRRKDTTCKKNTQTSVADLQFSPFPTSIKMEFNKSEISYGILKTSFGDDYEESYCSPRVFNIRLSAGNYLILHQNGYNSDIFRVHMSGDSTLDLSAMLPVSTLNELVSVIRAKLTVESTSTAPHGKCGKVSTKYINSVKNWQITSTQFEEFSEGILKEQVKQTELNLRNQMQDGRVIIPNKYQRSQSMIIYCGICFDELDSSFSTETPFLSLLPCNHVFCVNCWSSHIQSQLAQATFGIYCAEYKCSSEIDPIFVRSLVEYRLFRRFIQRKAELLLQTSDTAIFCTNPGCNKVIGMKGSLVNKEPVTVSCDCGTSVCLVCQKDPHWPIPCELLHHYTDALKKDGLYINIADFDRPVNVAIVDFKVCPKCKLPIERNGGCDYMFCSVCSTSFCWLCLVPFAKGEHGHQCTKRMVRTKKVEFTSGSPPWLNSKFYTQAVRQRCKIGGENEKRSKHMHPNLKTIKAFMPKRNVKESVNGVGESEDEGIKSLTAKLKRVTVYCYSARRHLENCAALNYIRKGQPAMCPHKLTLLEFYLDKIDRHLTEQKCSSKAIKSIFQTYNQAQQTSNSIITSFSNALYKA